MNIRPSTGFSSPSPSFGPRSVVVLMSGGVDSSVTAWLLKKEGRHVAGLTMRIPGQDGLSSGSCCGRDAAAVALSLSIPHYVADIEEEFRESVISPFVESYLAGETPNPCADCNAVLKFGRLWDAVEDAFGPVSLATGHYARVLRSGNGCALARGADASKDQSYFLYGIRRDRLPDLFLPLGDRSKEEVRGLAREAGLAVAEKKESMEICFAGEGDYRRLIENRSSRPGLIVDERGAPLGTHGGISNFTVGQRKGLGIASRKGLYVLRIDGEKDLVVVGPRERAFRRMVRAEETNVLLPDLLVPGAALFGKTRSRGEPLPLTVLECEGDGLLVRFAEPHFAPAPGQRLVVYDKEGRVAGGGVIRHRKEEEEWTA